jgi:hypothetical protein
MVAQVLVLNPTGSKVTLSPPSGWTLVRTDSSVAGDKFQSIFYKVATASEPTKYAWTASASVTLAGGIGAYSNVNTTAPIDVNNGQYNATASTSDSAPAVITTRATDRLLAFFGSFIGEGTTKWKPPAGMSGRWIVESSGATSDAACTDQALTIAGSTGPKTATFPTATTSVGALVALTPAGS